MTIENFAPDTIDKLDRGFVAFSLDSEYKRFDMMVQAMPSAYSLPGMPDGPARKLVLTERGTATT